MHYLRQSTADDVLIGPFVDSDDGWTAETGVSPAVKLSKNGQALGAKSDVTVPVSDADGYYNCELDATDTGTVGTLVLTVVGSAVSLPVRHEYQVVEEAVYDAMFGASAAGPLQSTTAGRKLDVTATGAAGIDWGNIENKATANDLSGTDIQLCDTVTTLTGHTVQTGDNFARLGAPAAASVSADIAAVSQQVDNIGAASGGALSFAPSSDNTSGAIDPGSTTKVWATVSGTFADVENDAGSSHDFTDTTDVIDHVYGFVVGGARQAVNCVFKVNIDGNNDEMVLQAWDHVGADWETVAVLEGTGGTATISGTPALFQKHTGTGSELGNVYLRFATASTTPSDLSVKLLNVEAVNIGQTIGYALGRIWIDTVNGTAGTEPHVNGTGDNAVLTLADALTLSASLGVTDFQLVNGSSITLTANSDNHSYFGDNWTLALGGVSMAATLVSGAAVSGICTGSGTTFLGCEIGAVTVGDDCHMLFCGINGTVTLPAGTLHADQCYHHAVSPAIFDFGGAVLNTTLHLHHYAGGVELQNMGQSGTDILHLDGNGRLVTSSNCIGGTVNRRGAWELTDSGTGQTINLDITVSAGYQNGRVYIDTVNGVAGTQDHENGVADHPVDSLADAKTLAASLGLSDFHIVNGSSITLVASTVDESYFGNNWTLALGGQDITGAFISGADVSGIATATGKYEFEECALGAVTLDNDGHFERCGLEGTFTVGQAGNFTFHQCFTEVAGSITLNFGALGATTVNLLSFDGKIAPTNMATGDVSFITGRGQITTATCTGGTIDHDGEFQYTDAGGNVTENKSDIENDVSSTLTDTAEIGTAGAGLSDLGGMSTGMKAEVNAEADTALSDYDGPTNAEMVARTILATAYFDPAADTVALVATVTTLTGHTAQTADHTAAIADIPTVAEFNARTIVSANYFDPAADAVANVTLVATVTTLTGHTAQTGDSFPRIGANGAGLSDLGGMSTGMKAEINVEVDGALDTTMADSVVADGSIPTMRQAMYMITQFLFERAVSSTTVTVKKVDGSTSLMTFTLDDAVTPTSITRAS
jgi:hypothetical protein